MTRAKKDVVNYFPHDSDAANSDTMVVLQSRFGNDGYAFWFKLLEKLADTEGHYLDFNNKVKWQLFLAKAGVDEKIGVEIMNLLVEMQAIDQDLWASNVVWCQKLVDNVIDVYKNRRRETPSKPVITSKNGISTGKNDISTGENPQRGGEGSRVDKSRKEKQQPDKNAVNLYEDCFGQVITPHAGEVIADWEKNYPFEWIEYAFKQAAENNVRKIKYVETILKKLESNGGNLDKKSTKQSNEPKELDEYYRDLRS